MRPQIGKRTNKNSNQEYPKTMSREFIEKNLRKNLAIREEYLPLEYVKTAININAIEQRIFVRKKVIQMLKENYTNDELIGKFEDENHFDRHRLQKML
nr:hypothetical protein [Bacteroidota bacterium]